MPWVPLNPRMKKMGPNWSKSNGGRQKHTLWAIASDTTFYKLTSAAPPQAQPLTCIDSRG